MTRVMPAVLLCAFPPLQVDSQGRFIVLLPEFSYCCALSEHMPHEVSKMAGELISSGSRIWQVGFSAVHLDVSL